MHIMQKISWEYGIKNPPSNQQKEKYRNRFRETQNKLYAEKRVSKGICTRCGKLKVVPGEKKCGICLEKDMILHRNRRAMRSNFNRLSKPEVDLIIKKTNFTEEEEVIFHMLCRGKSLDQICLETFLPKSTLCRRIHSIKEKVGDDKVKKQVPIMGKSDTYIRRGCGIQQHRNQ